MDDEICEAYMACAEFGLSTGMENLKEYPGVWEHRVDDNWQIAANGHTEPLRTSTGLNVPPFHFLVLFHEWPVGLIAPNGGTLEYCGDECTEDKLIDALRAASKATNDH